MSDLPRFSPTIAMLAIARHWDAALSDALAPLGFTIRKLALLGHLQRTPGISFSELARRSRITVQSTHTAMASLVERGWVEDESARTGAASRLQLTKDGVDALGRARRAVAALDVEFETRHPSLSRALQSAIPPTFDSGSSFS